MAIIGVRDLVRKSKDILARVEDEQEPFLITHHGRPVAALVPVDPAHAERYLAAAAPDLAATYRDAASLAEAGKRPETQTIEQLALQHGDPPEGRAQPVPHIGTLRMVLTQDAKYLFGAGVAEGFAEAASLEVAKIVANVAGLVREETPTEPQLANIAALNAGLFSVTLRRVVAAALAERMTHLDEYGAGAEGVLGASLAEEALAVTTRQVHALNLAIVGDGTSLDTYKTSLRASIEALAANRFAQGPGADLGTVQARGAVGARFGIPGYGLGVPSPFTSSIDD